MDWYTLVHTLAGLPALVISSLLLGLLLHIRWPRVGITLLWLTAVVLVGLSAPATGHRLMRSLELYPPLASTLDDGAQAIVVLGGGRQGEAPEYGIGADSVSRYALERLRYGAYLHRRTGLPLMLVGGSTHGEPVSEAELMKTAMTRDFALPVKWIETRSRTTFENAKFAKAILDRAGIKRVYLVTHAWHMRRAVLAFAAAGVDVVPAGHDYSYLSPYEPAFTAYLPNMAALMKSGRALHEYIGYHWYRYRLARGDLDRPLP